MNQETNQPMLTDDMIQSITGSGPWIRFFSVLGFISVGFMLLGGIIMAAVFVMGSAIAREPGMMFMLPMSILYIVFAIVYLFPSIYLWQTASAIVQVRKGKLSAGAATALERQRKFWKFIGIVTICFLALYPVFFIVMIVAGLI